MNTSGEAADQVLNMSLKSIEVAAKISGEGAKNLAVYLYAVLNGTKQTKGKARLETMLKTGKELKIFALKKEDLEKFSKEAKVYGVMYCALKDKNNIDNMIDVMVKAEDGAKISRIMDKFKIACVEMAEVKTDILEDKEDKEKSPLALKDESLLRNSLKNKDSLNNNKHSVREDIKNISKDAGKANDIRSKIMEINR